MTALSNLKSSTLQTGIAMGVFFVVGVILGAVPAESEDVMRASL